MKERITQLLAALNRGIYEKENEVALSLLAAVAGESIILLGPPGVAKSMVARRLKDAFSHAQSFEYLMSRFSTPDEIFGPVSISKLKTSDNYERATAGYLPTADVVFLDEIWKAGPAIQNTLLTVINEKVFRNGRSVVSLPLKLLVAASNELPARGEGLEALWDRFIIRLESKSIGLESNFDSMLCDENSLPPAVPRSLQITESEYSDWSRQIPKVTIGADVLDAIHKIRRSLGSVKIEGSDERRAVYVSDRRWKNIAHLLRVSAFLQDRQAVGTEDLVPIYNCLWQEPDERDALRDAVVGCIFSPYAQKLDEMKRSMMADIRQARTDRNAGRVPERRRERDAAKKLYSKSYYLLADYAPGPCYVVARDYQLLPDVGQAPASGVLYSDPRRPNIAILRTYDGTAAAPIGSTPVTLARDESHIYLDGKAYTLEAETAAPDLPSQPTGADSGRDYGAEIDLLAGRLSDLQRRIGQNIFVAAADRRHVEDYLRELYRQMALTRQDIGKLYY